MFLDLNKIEPGGTEFDTDLRLDPVQGPGKERYPVSGVHVRGRVVPREGAADFEAHLRARVDVPCSRCLVAVPWDIAGDVHLRLVREMPEPSGSEIGVEDEDAELFRVAEGRLVLEEVVQEQIYLELPLKPICSEECKGLCPECGADRNTTRCDCSEHVIDSRLAPLLELKKDPKVH
jgi:uncharacterized protein